MLSYLQRQRAADFPLETRLAPHHVAADVDDAHWWRDVIRDLRRVEEAEVEMTQSWAGRAGVCKDHVDKEVSRDN